MELWGLGPGRKTDALGLYHAICLEFKSHELVQQRTTTVSCMLFASGRVPSR